MFCGSVMDWTKTPAEFRPENLYAAVSFDAVNRVFRDGKVFNSHIYDSTIGLFIGPTILAMEGKTHWDHRNLVSAAFKSRSLLRWEPEIVRPVVNALIDEFVDAGEADLVRDFTLEFPTRVISKLLGLPEEDLPWFRKRAVDLISYHVKYKRAFEASAALKDYFLDQIEKRRSHRPRTSSAIWSPPRSTARSSATKPSTRSCDSCCPRGWRRPTGHRGTCCSSC